MMAGKEGLMMILLAKAALVSWVIILPFMILWRLDRIIKLLEKK
jgi:hypothetical protein